MIDKNSAKELESPFYTLYEIKKFLFFYIKRKF